MRKIFVLWLLLLSVVSLAQPYSVKQLGIEKGLSNNYVVSIAQDKQGFLWFATEEGLNKFDGTRFITYLKNEDLTRQGITGNELNCLLDDPQDSILWIGTQRAGLNAYDYVNNTFLCYRHDGENPESLITDDVTKIVAATDGNLWITTYWRGVDYFDKKAGKFIHYNTQTVPGLASDNIWSVVDGGDGKLYMGHVHHGFSVLSLKDKKVKNFMHDPEDPVSLPGNGVTCIYKDLSGNIWLGTDRGLALFNPEAENFIHFHHSEDGVPHTVFDIRQFDGNKLWIAMEFGGIAILDLTQRMFLSPDQVRFQYIKEGDDEYSLSNSTVRCLFQDSFKNVWAGMWGGGINFLSHESSYFNVYSYSPIQHSGSSLNNKTASSVCVARDGKLWIGTDGGGINVFDKGKRVAVYKEETGDLTDNSIQAALCDSEGNLWFGSFMGGVDFYDVKKKSFHQIFPKDKTGEDVRALYEDAEYVWIGTSNGIYKVRLHDKGIADHYTVENNLVRCISKDNLNRLWIGTFGGGLGVFDEHFQCVKLFNVTSLFPSNTINTVYMDSQNRMWIGTGEGLVCFPSSQSWDYKVYRSEEGLSNVHIRAITEDNHGNIWVSTNKGISCLLKDKEVFYNYDHWDNVPMGNFMSGSVAEAKDGTLYFGSINGLCRFNPDQVLEKRESPAAIITEMRIFGPLRDTDSNEKVMALEGQSEVRLSYMQNNFSVTFNIQNYALADQVEYAYMLKGLENSWYTVTDPNNVTFRNIPPGNYCFQVKTRIRNQEWADEIASLDIRIDPPVWLTWWAKLFYILSGVSVLYFILHAYKKKLDMESLYELEKKNHEQEQELNNERLRFYTNITHELRTPLTLILGPLEDMQKSNSLSGKDSQKISVIHQSAIRLLNLINQILEFRKTETQNKKLCVSRDNLAALVHEIGLKYKELNRKPEIDFCLEIEQEDMSLFFDKEVVTIILDNLISNAIKYTEKGTITLGLHQVVRNNIHHTEISVSDTGFGIAPDALPHIFDRYYQESGKHQASGTGIGLALVKNLVTLHEGEIRAESMQNEGSTFYISLLTDNIYPNALHADSTEPIQEDTNQEASLEYPQETTLDTGKPILLIVEDNEEFRQFMYQQLSQEYQVWEASNGEEAEAIANEKEVDIIVSDVMMPGMDGFELCLRLKENMKTSHIFIILLTARTGDENELAGYQSGADCYLTKPFNMDILKNRIQHLLALQQKRKQIFLSGIEVNAEDLTSSKVDERFLEKAIELVEKNLDNSDYSVEAFSDDMCMSRMNLYRKLQIITGQKPTEFIRSIRLKKAAGLLTHTELTVIEISEKVGFATPSYFSKCFKEMFGVLPTQYHSQD